MIPRWLFLSVLLAGTPLHAQTPWPTQTPPVQVDVQPVADSGPPGVFAWTSGRFLIRSDLKLPNGVEIPELRLGKEHDAAVVTAQELKQEVEAAPTAEAEAAAGAPGAPAAAGGAAAPAAAAAPAKKDEKK